MKSEHTQFLFRRSYYCYFTDEVMKPRCLDPQIRRPPGTSVLLTLCLSATSPAAALWQRAWRTTGMSYGSLKLLPALTQNGGCSLSPFCLSCIIIQKCIFSCRHFLSPYIYLKLCIHFNLPNTFLLPNNVSSWIIKQVLMSLQRFTLQNSLFVLRLHKACQ